MGEEILEIEKEVISSGVGIAEEFTESFKKTAVIYLKKKKGWQVLPPDLRGETEWQLGPFFAKGSRSVFKPVSDAVEAFVLPRIVGAAYGSNEFPIEANKYWNNYTFTPKEEGTVLDISTKKMMVPNPINPGTMVEVDMPLNFDDYVVYMFSINDPKVAATKEDLENKDQFDYYIVNEQEEKEAEKLNHKLMKEAGMEYFKLVSETEANKERILQILEVMKKPEEYIVPMDNDELEALLKKRSEEPLVADKNGRLYSRFVRVVNSPNLSERAFLSKCITYGVVNKAGNALFHGEDLLGNSTKEALAKLQDRLFSGQRIIMEQKLKEAVKDFR